MEPLDTLDIGRLFRLKLDYSAAVRQAALDTLRPLPMGGWQVRIGGRQRGETVRFPTREAAVAAVHAHYNARLRSYAEELVARQRRCDG